MLRFYDKRIGKYQVNITPGEMYVTKQDERIFTVLGSCIAVCLLDDTASIGGMNHFMLAKRDKRDTEDARKGRYGNLAMDRLFRSMLARGAKQEHLNARIVGGAATTPTCCANHCVAKENTRFAKAYLEETNIPIVSYDTGGSSARQLYFDVRSGRISVRLLARKGFDSCETIMHEPGAKGTAGARCCQDVRMIKRAT